MLAHIKITFEKKLRIYPYISKNRRKSRHYIYQKTASMKLKDESPKNRRKSHYLYQRTTSIKLKDEFQESILITSK